MKGQLQGISAEQMDMGIVEAYPETQRSTAGDCELLGKEID